MRIVVILLREIIAIINLLVNPSPKNAPYTILIESNYICSFRPKWLLTCRHFCLPPSLWSLVPGQTHDLARTKNHYFAFLKSYFELNNRLLAVYFFLLDPSSSYSHFTMSIGHIHVQLPYFSSFLRFRLHFLDYEINMRLVKVQLNNHLAFSFCYNI